MKATLVFYGTGASMGVPSIGCSCAVCVSSSSFNKRTRPAVLIEYGEKRFIIDVGPDFRSQALHHKLKRLDGVILTHTHYDHIAGIDDLRMFAFLQQAPIPCLMLKPTFEEMKIRYHYLFDEEFLKKPKFTFQILDEDQGDTNFEGLNLSYFTYEQLGMPVLGVRIQDLAYITDIKHYDEKIFKKLEGIKTLVISACNWSATRAHFGIDDVIAFAKRCNPEKIYLTHIGHELDHESTNQALPDHIKLCYDGMRLDFHIN